MTESTDEQRWTLPDEAPRHLLWWVFGPIVALLIFGLGVALGRHTPTRSGDGAAANTPQEPASEQLWTCSMHPQIQQSEPGDCPLCGMELIPLAESGAASNQKDRVVLSQRAATLAELQTVEVERIVAPSVDIRLLGRVEVDESRARNISAWIGGRVDKLRVRETGVTVKRGQTIANLYSPEVYAAHQDLLTAAKQVRKLANASDLVRSSAEATLAAARERLSLLGVPDAEIRRMDDAKRPSKSIAIRASYAGTVMERLVTEGQYVETGTVLYRVADLSKLWVQLDAYERDLPALMEGQTVEVEVEALPGERFVGEVSFIDPLVDPRRRVTKVRVEVDNPEAKLRPGMFVEAVVRGAPEDGTSRTKQKPLVIPATAPLFTGRRSLVYVEIPDAERMVYEPRVVELGPRMGEQYPVVAGLSAGERVVTHGAFALDADLQIRGGPSMMTRPDDASSEPLTIRVELDHELRAALAPVLRAYLDMQVALADDDWQAARAAASRLQDAARAVEFTTADTREAWEALGPSLEAKAEAAAHAVAIEGVRGAFLHLSMIIKDMLQVFGNPIDAPVRLAFCPMANANEGAEWIQAAQSVDNSYFGESMLSCGEIRATLEPDQHLLVATSGASPSAAPGGHQH